MLWLIVLLLIAGLSFVLLHKPNVNPMGAGWTPPERRPDPHPAATARDAADARPADASPGALAVDAGSDFEDAITTPVPKQALDMAATFELDDLVASGVQAPAPTDRPRL